jgi:lipoprotein-anchoring transpeptidase ErfK/SrfK
MIASLRRPVFITAVAVLGLALAACTSGPPRPRPIAGPPPSAEDALAAYRDDLGTSDPAQDATVSAEEIEYFREKAEVRLKGRGKKYDIVVFINKAGSGPTAQHAFLFVPGDGGYQPLDVWLVSTGREQQETSPKGAHKFTTTPQGVFEFDIAHFSRLHKSNAWEADMPYAMFLKTQRGGPTTGIALHAALDKYVHNLGQRASAGCIRLLPANAEKLWKKLMRGDKGVVIVEDVDETEIASNIIQPSSLTR